MCVCVCFHLCLSSVALLSLLCVCVFLFVSFVSPLFLFSADLGTVLTKLGLVDQGIALLEQAVEKNKTKGLFVFQTYGLVVVCEPLSTLSLLCLSDMILVVIHRILALAHLTRTVFTLPLSAVYVFSLPPLPTYCVYPACLVAISPSLMSWVPDSYSHTWQDAD